MTRRPHVRLMVAGLLLVANAVAAGVAATQGEWPHAGLHAGLFLLGAYLVWRLAPKRGGRRVGHRGVADVSAVDEFAARLASLELSVDAVALEVERIGEGQRFEMRLLAENGCDG